MGFQLGESLLDWGQVVRVPLCSEATKDFSVREPAHEALLTKVLT
jgi:hypothetical protein